MELTYMVRGADGKEYGPVTTEQLSGWINEGRVSAHQELRRSDMQDWAAASAFQELQGLFNPPVQVVSSPTPSPLGRPAHAKISPAVPAQMKSGASWFYWIAALSLINSVMSLTGSGFGFALGLGITQMIDAIAGTSEGAGKGIAFGLDLAAAGLFVFFGIFAHKAHTWAFVIGMILFGLDSAIVIMGQAWLSLALHGLALFYLFRGMQACRELRRAAE